MTTISTLVHQVNSIDNSISLERRMQLERLMTSKQTNSSQPKATPLASVYRWL